MNIQANCPVCDELIGIEEDDPEIFACPGCDDNLVICRAGGNVSLMRDPDAIQTPSIPSSEKISPSELGTSRSLASGRES